MPTPPPPPKQSVHKSRSSCYHSVVELLPYWELQATGKWEVTKKMQSERRSTPANKWSEDGNLLLLVHCATSCPQMPACYDNCMSPFPCLPVLPRWSVWPASASSWWSPGCTQWAARTTGNISIHCQSHQLHYCTSCHSFHCTLQSVLLCEKQQVFFLLGTQQCWLAHAICNWLKGTVQSFSATNHSKPYLASTPQPHIIWKIALRNFQMMVKWKKLYQSWSGLIWRNKMSTTAFTMGPADIHSGKE